MSGPHEYEQPAAFTRHRVTQAQGPLLTPLTSRSPPVEGHAPLDNSFILQDPLRMGGPIRGISSFGDLG